MLKSVIKRKSTPGLIFLVSITALLLIVFELLRVILLLRYRYLAVDIPSLTLLKSFLIGLRFDLAITCYIIAPIAIIGLLPYIGLSGSRLTRILTLVYLTIMGSIAFLMTIIDLEFYGEFNTRLNHLAISWMNAPGVVFQMIWEMSSTIPLLLFWAALTTGFGYALYRVSRLIFKDKPPEQFVRQLIIYPLIMALLFLGMRGRISYRSPLRWGVAYFSNYYFANQLALNSCFTFVRDVLDTETREKEKRLSSLMPSEEALSEVRRLLEIDSTALLPGHPIAHWESPVMSRTSRIEAANKTSPLNVVLILMESLSAEFIGSCGGKISLAAEFDRIAEEGLLFPRFFCAGGHTRNALFTIFTGLPSLLGRESYAKRSESQLPFSGLPLLLRQRGYSVYAYVTHDPVFDNKQGFFISNGFNRVFGEKDYPRGGAISAWGVADEVLYNKALDNLEEHEEPFFVILEPSSNHTPYITPDRPFPRTDPSHPDAKRFNSFCYADWAMGRFWDRALDTDWGKRTLFLIMGDTGDNWNPKLELDMSWFRTPLLIVCPSVIEPGVSDRIGGQKDITATVMDILGGEWINNTLGRSMLDNDYAGHALFVEHEAYGFITGDYYLMHSLSGKNTLYDLQNLEPAQTEEEVLNSMFRNARALLSATLHLITTRQVELPLPEQVH